MNEVRRGQRPQERADSADCDQLALVAVRGAEISSRTRSRSLAAALVTREGMTTPTSAYKGTHMQLKEKETDFKIMLCASDWLWLIGKCGVTAGSERQVAAQHDTGASLRSARAIETTEKQSREEVPIKKKNTQKKHTVLMDNPVRSRLT